MPVMLEILSGALSGCTQLLPDDGCLTIGRTEKSDLAIPFDPLLSGVHFCLQQRESRWVLSDQESRNGTFLAGEQLRGEVQLKGDEEIKAGNTLFRIRHLSQPTTGPTTTSRNRPGAMTAESVAEVSQLHHHKAAEEETEIAATAKLARLQQITQVVFSTTGDSPQARRFWIRPGQTREIGRTERADTVFSNDSQMSRAHFRVSCETGQCRLEDLDSSNGTFVNGARVGQAILGDGDTITAGKTKLRVTVQAKTDSGSDPEPAC